jgi:hypothetical protein
MAIFLAFQAGLNGIFGSAEEALALLSQAKEVMRAHGEFNCEAELLRLEAKSY